MITRIAVKRIINGFIVSWRTSADSIPQDYSKFAANATIAGELVTEVLDAE
jgi:hypothetical protein